jgi:hypothetical protein
MSELTVEPRKVTEEDLKELQRLLRKDCIDGILVDATLCSAEYVRGYNVERGGE